MSIHTSKQTLSTYRVEIPVNRNSYYLIFQVKGRKRPLWRTLDTTDEKIALARGKQKFEDFHKGRHEVLKATAGTNTYALIGTLCEIYIDKKPVKNPRTVVNCLLRMLMIAFKCDKKKAKAMRSDVLTKEFVLKYRENLKASASAAQAAALAAATTQEERDKALKIVFNKAGCNSRISHAKSMFTNADEIFRDVKLPALDAFRDAKGEKNATSEAGFIPLPADTIPTMEAAAEQIRETMPMTRRAFLLFRHFGLRPIEAEAVRGRWFERDGCGAVYLAIRNRPEEGFTIKNSIEHFIRVPDHLVKEFTALPPDEFVLHPEMTVNLRHRFVARTMSDWVRQFIPDRQKSTYELRKYAGSEIYERHGIEAAKYFLGHVDIATTQKWYVAWLRRVDAAGHHQAAIPEAEIIALHDAARALLDCLDGGVTGETLKNAKAKLAALIPKTETVENHELSH